MKEFDRIFNENGHSNVEFHHPTKGRFQMRVHLPLIACLALTGCIAGAANGRSTTEYVHDDGIHPVQRTSVSQTYSGTSVGASVPIVMPGGYGYGGYGGGYGMTGGGDIRCALHPDRCAVIQTATIVQPAYVVSNGGTTAVGPGGAGTYGEPRDTADLEARIARVEEAIPKVAGGAILSLRQSCYAILENPKVIKDEAEREKIAKGCEKVLKAATTEEAK